MTTETRQRGLTHEIRRPVFPPFVSYAISTLCYLHPKSARTAQILLRKVRHGKTRNFTEKACQDARFDFFPCNSVSLPWLNLNFFLVAARPRQVICVPPCASVVFSKLHAYGMLLGQTLLAQPIVEERIEPATCGRLHVFLELRGGDALTAVLHAEIVHRLVEHVGLQPHTQLVKEQHSFGGRDPIPDIRARGFLEVRQRDFTCLAGGGVLLAACLQSLRQF